MCKKGLCIHVMFMHVLILEVKIQIPGLLQLLRRPLNLRLKQEI